MKCKFCDAELEAGVTKCPGCGAEVESTQKLSGGKIALLVILAVAALAVVAALIMGGLTPGEDVPETDPPATDPSAADPSVGETVPQTEPPATIPADGNPDDVTCKGSYTVTDSELEKLLANPIATVGDLSMTNADIQIYYWMGFYNFLESYSGYAAMLGLDVYSPLDTQIGLDGTITWQQYFLDSGLNDWHTYAALTQKAESVGFELSEEYRDELAAIPSSLQESAVAMGFADAAEMIQADFGPGATLEAYVEFMRVYYTGMLYYGEQAEQIELTEEEVAAYFAEHEEEYAAKGLTKETRLVDVRHILLQPEGGTVGEDGKTVYSEEEWEACRAAAQAILDEYLAGEQSEERFAQLAGQHSTDPGSSSNGGLYTDVYTGQMVEPFDAWCFDATRITGDTGLVRTNYGYHIMYFVDFSLAWRDTAWNDMLGELADKIVYDALEEFPMEVDFENIALGYVDFAAAG